MSFTHPTVPSGNRAWNSGNRNTSGKPLGRFSAKSQIENTATNLRSECRKNLASARGRLRNVYAFLSVVIDLNEEIALATDCDRRTVLTNIERVMREASGFDKMDVDTVMKRFPEELRCLTRGNMKTVATDLAALLPDLAPQIAAFNLKERPKLPKNFNDITRDEHSPVYLNFFEIVLGTNP